MARADYWNRQYLEYFKGRVSEANTGQVSSTITPGDRSMMSDNVIREQLDRLRISRTDAVLDLGCGYGRLFPMLLQQSLSVSGADISSAMIAEARQSYGAMIRELRVEEAEKCSFPDQSFDRVVCWGVFDATQQLNALSEIVRVLRTGGLALISGKSNSYCDDDDQAILAEGNARQKGHPNYFTDYDGFTRAVRQLGSELHSERFYLRRGDLALNKYLESRQVFFYEFLVIVEKQRHIERPSASSFSDSFSLTWRRVHRI